MNNDNNHQASNKRVFKNGTIITNSSPPSPAYMCQWTGSALVQIMACPLFGDKPLSEIILIYCQSGSFQLNFYHNSYIFIQENVFEIVGHFVQGEMC